MKRPSSKHPRIRQVYYFIVLLGVFFLVLLSSTFFKSPAAAASHNIRRQQATPPRPPKQQQEQDLTTMGFTKQILRAGNGVKPKRGQSVTVHCTGFGKNRDLNQKFWSTKDPGQQPFTFNVGMGSGEYS